MKTISEMTKVREFTLDRSVFMDKDVQAFMVENNLTEAMLKHSYADLVEYIHNKDKYQLFWYGMVELIALTEVKVKNPGLEYLEKPIFKMNMTLEDIITNNPGKAEAIDKAWKLRNNGFFLTGANGIGKTYFAVALANKRYETTRESTLFVFWPDFVQVAKRFERESYQMINQVKHAKFLIIDDLGQETITSFSRDDILNPIITYRMEKGLNTIITSNYELDELNELYTIRPIESKKVKSIFLKMTKLSKPIKMVGEDLRNGQEN
ncbi:ATP-binding protein [Mollicutes bacterium LVI A0078]|nr:ATP-binding protein [Mollicutes bacterium LVI A0075]WOO91262.1 ATP-binding protein [Mollicutes bacterium LVI A0078]